MNTFKSRQITRLAIVLLLFFIFLFPHNPFKSIVAAESSDSTWPIRFTMVSRQLSVNRRATLIETHTPFVNNNDGYLNYLPLVSNMRIPPPSEFSKLRPGDGYSERLLDLELAWEDSFTNFTYGAGFFEYCYDSTDDQSCTNWVNDGTNKQALISDLKPETVYFWQVRAVNESGTVYANGDEGAFWSFTTGDGSTELDKMINIPAGEFQMGCDPAHNAGYPCYEWELPLHTVYLDEYAIDMVEVTNGQYAECVTVGDCSEPEKSSSYTRESYYGNPDFDDYPVINVTWQDANNYCNWAGKRLPTEAEWEKAAKGTNPQAFPWGDAAATCQLANYSETYESQCFGDTNEVGAYPGGASPYGVMDMAGNVEEWVNDWYDEDYYAQSPLNDPPGPTDGSYRVIRGGHCYSTGELLSTSFRTYDSRTSIDFLGFRCAASP